VPTVLLKSGKQFDALTGTSLLEAASASGIHLPYSCRTGRCSSCKCKVLEGKTSAIQAELGLSKQELAEGWILGCVRSAETDILLEVEDLGDLQLPSPKTYPCRIQEINQFASDVIQVFLRLPPNVEFNFIPGQYVEVIGPDGIRRSYSLANSSFKDKLLELHIRFVDGGVLSQYWFNQAKPNDLLRLYGPLGTFFLREPAGLDLIFIATGTGIAPIKSLLGAMQNLSEKGLPKSVTVLWGGRKSSDLYFDFESLAFSASYVPVLSRSESDWSGAKGYVQDVLLGLNPCLANSAVYACGSDAMINGAKRRLIEAGLPANRFYSDAFVSSGAT
jgi:CDP-4-dehydro-6-deoxyglucose reductase, E3